MSQTRTLAKWNALRPDYRKRLQRKGITYDTYISGAPLSAARGHAKTPERPQRAWKHPDSYDDYLERIAARRRLASEPDHTLVPGLEEHVRRIFVDALYAGLVDRVDLHTVQENLKKLPHAKQLQLLSFTFERWQSMAREDGEIDNYWTVDHGFDRINVFYYH